LILEVGLMLAQHCDRYGMYHKTRKNLTHDSQLIVIN
jgi:hypothetical protein